jgi:ABC-type lipoprotein release transport system permease subunit
MKILPLDIFKVILSGKYFLRFIIAAILSFAFSIAVILSTIGLMDGFEKTLKSGLQLSNGDISVKTGHFFLAEPETEDVFKRSNLIYTSVLQVEAFSISEEETRGVLVKGFEPQTFSQVIGLDLTIGENEIAIGQQLANELKLGIGDEISLAIASKDSENLGAPIISNFLISQIINHGIYEKDLRFVYIHKNHLQKLLKLPETWINFYYLKTGKSIDKIDAIVQELKGQISSKFRVQPFWQEFDTLLRAVEVEKVTITIMMQIIVVVAIFNIFALIIFIAELKAKEFFLLRALGLSLKKINQFWYVLIFFIWLFACLLSIAMTSFFGWVITTLPLFKLPSEIYVLNEFKLHLGLNSYMIVFILAFVWVYLICFIGLLRLRNKSVIAAMKKEFA